MAKVIGSVDDLGRPVVRIEVPDRDGFLAVVDTGFKRSLLLLISEAQAMGFVVTEDAETVELGTAVKTKVLRARGMVRWLDRTIQVEALVSDEPMPVSGRVSPITLFDGPAFSAFEGRLAGPSPASPRIAPACRRARGLQGQAFGGR